MTLKNHSLAPKPGKAPAVDLLKDLSDDDLLRLRNEIDKKLQLDPRSLNMGDELGAQYRAGKALLAKIQDDNDVPANQRAQVFNSVGTMLKELTKLMGVVYDAERLKRYEAAFMKTLQDLPEPQQRRFFDLYSDYLNADGTPK
jgi:hypothetical protein